MHAQNRWTIAWLLAGAILSIGIVDAFFWQINPPNHLREVSDALGDLAKANPDVLVISSSHGRTFHVVGQELERRTGGRMTTVAVPLEAGRASSMEWVLRERVQPLVDRNRSRGDARRPSRLLFGITWWDTCRREERIPIAEANVVSRAWRLSDYLQDVAAHGMNELNRNFVRFRFQQHFGFSSLARDRGRLSNLGALKRRLRGQEHVRTDEEEAEFLHTWQEDIDTGGSCVLAPAELEAIDRVVDFGRQHRLDTTIVLFPLKPATITAHGREATLRPFSAAMRAYGETHGVRVVDLTEMPVILDGDFMQDYDHLSATGNRKFATRVLDHELRFLGDAVTTP